MTDFSEEVPLSDDYEAHLIKAFVMGLVTGVAWHSSSPNPACRLCIGFPRLAENNSHKLHSFISWALGQYGLSVQSGYSRMRALSGICIYVLPTSNHERT